MSGKDKARRESAHDAARARRKAQDGEQAAQLGHQRLILDLGDRAVEIVAGDKPGVWHAVVDGTRGPVLTGTSRTGKTPAGRSGRPEHVPVAGVTGPSVSGGSYGPYPGPASGVPVPGKALTPMEEYLAVMSEPTGLTAFELSRLVPDQPQGTCLSCRMKLTARDGTVKCAWCLTLDSLSRPAARLRPAWPCKCGCPSQAAHEIHIGVRPAAWSRYRSPGMAVFSVLMAVAAWYVACHLFAPFIVLAVCFTALALVHATGKRRPRP